MKRILIPAALAGGVLAAAVPATAAWAPSPVATAWAQQTAMGYAPCKPVVTPLPAERVAQGILADADNGEQSGTCEIRMGDKNLDWVAWHEVCHLSTVGAIYRSNDVHGLVDPVHEHPLFKQCLRFGPSETGGY